MSLGMLWWWGGRGGYWLVAEKVDDDIFGLSGQWLRCRSWCWLCCCVDGKWQHRTHAHHTVANVGHRLDSTRLMKLSSTPSVSCTAYVTPVLVLILFYILLLVFYKSIDFTQYLLFLYKSCFYAVSVIFVSHLCISLLFLHSILRHVVSPWHSLSLRCDKSCWYAHCATCQSFIKAPLL